MAHLTHFGLDNFRVFSDPTLFEFSPITILTGTNSSGKSSLTKGLLTTKNLLQGKKIYVEENKGSENPEFNSGLFEDFEIPYELMIGDFLSCINNSTGQSNIQIKLPIRLTNLENLFILTLNYEPNIEREGYGLLKEFLLKYGDNPILTCIKDFSGGWEAKINFTFLKNSLVKEVNKAEQIFLLSNKISQIKEEFREGNTPQFNLSEQAKNEIKKIINKQYLINPSLALLLERNQNHNNLFYFPTQMFFTDFIDENNISYYLWWNQKLKMQISYDKKLPLLNYSFFYPTEYLSTYLDYKFDDKDEFLDYINLNKKLHENYIRKINTGKIASFLDKELEWFNSLRFYGEECDLGQILAWDLFNSNFYRGNPEGILEYFEIKNSPMKNFIPSNDFIITEDKDNKFILQNVDYLINKILSKGLGNSLNMLAECFSKMEYLPSIRNIPNRIFLYDDDSVFKKILKHLTTHQLSDDSKNFINEQINNFEIADSIEFLKLPDGIGTRVVLKKGDEQIELVDVGYGVSQVLPIILQIAIQIETNESYSHDAKKYIHLPSSLIIEEPETNLHPALQSKLADLFVECYKKYNIQLIIETHSEYLIRKLQYLTGKGEIEPEMTQLYYFNHPDKIPKGEKQIKKINIQKDGSLTNDFGTGFFDEATNWKFELTKLKNVQKN